MDEIMRVKDLIEYLSNKNPNKKVYIDYGGTMVPLTKEEVNSLIDCDFE